MALANTRRPHSQGSASVQAHRTGGVTGSEGQEGANGVGGGIGVGGGNGDGNGDVVVVVVVVIPYAVCVGTYLSIHC